MYICDAQVYVDVLKRTVLPFIKDRFPGGHRFVQDNDPKHKSNYTRAFFEQHGINWWQTPPESPDLNPIENMWHELKEHLRKHVKPTTKDQLVEGIAQFWTSITKKKCEKYINHLQKVLPLVVDLNGAATGY